MVERGQEVHIVEPAASRRHGTWTEVHEGQEMTAHRLRSWRWYPQGCLSSGRRHTIYWRDWSSDVCSSDLTSSDTAPLPTMAAVVQQMLEPVGIDVEIQTVPSSIYFNTDWLETPLNITNWGGRATPSQYLTTAYVTGSVWNASHWSNPTFDGLVGQLDAELDFDKRKELAQQIATIMTDEVPSIIPFFINAVTFVRANLQGYVPDRIGFRDLRRTYLSPN